MKTEDEIRKQLEIQQEMLSHVKGKGCAMDKQHHLRAIEMLVWVLG